MTRNRKQRLLRILELISTRRVHTQEELVEALAADGWEVTQSSVSRDIAALGLVKQDGVYHRPLPDAKPIVLIAPPAAPMLPASVGCTST